MLITTLKYITYITSHHHSSHGNYSIISFYVSIIYLQYFLKKLKKEKEKIKIFLFKRSSHPLLQ